MRFALRLNLITVSIIHTEIYRRLLADHDFVDIVVCNASLSGGSLIHRLHRLPQYHLPELPWYHFPKLQGRRRRQDQLE